MKGLDLIVLNFIKGIFAPTLVQGYPFGVLIVGGVIAAIVKGKVK